MTRRFLPWLTTVGLLVALKAQAMALPAAPPVHVFGSPSCSLCEEAATYLRFVAQREGTIFYFHDVSQGGEALRLMGETEKELGVTADGVPFIVVGRHWRIGWDRSRVGPQVEDDLVVARANAEPDAVAVAAERLKREPPLLPKAKPPLGWALGLVVLAAGLGALYVVIKKRRPHL